MHNRRRIAAKIPAKLCRMHHWILPHFPDFYRNFKDKIPENWREVLAGTDPASITEVGEFFRRMELSCLLKEPGKPAQVIAARRFLVENTLFPPENSSASAYDVMELLPGKITEYFRGRGVISVGKFTGTQLISRLGNYLPGQIFSVSEPLTSLDELLFDQNIPIALLQADTGGNGILTLDGAEKIINRDHPVLVLSCWHDPLELFGQYTLLKNKHPFYKLSFSALPPRSGWKLTLLAIPEDYIG